MSGCLGPGLRGVGGGGNWKATANGYRFLSEVVENVLN